MNVPFLLHTISSFSKETLAKTSQLVLQGLRACVDEPGPLRNEIMTSPDFWAILRVLSSRADSTALAFEILERGAGGTPPAIMADNYEAAVSQLNDFATFAGRAIVAEQKGDPRQRKPRSSKREASQNDIVSRGIKAIGLIYDMTARIPHLMKQSHLESSEG